MSTSGQTRTTGHWFRDGEAWIVGLAGLRTPLRDSKGLAHLAQLLARPGEEVGALDLVAAVEGHVTGSRGAPDPALTQSGFGDAGALLDAEAKAAYRARLADAQEELEEAERFNDPGRAERARTEIEFIARELSTAVGLGGRDRRASSAVERARVNVTRAIKTTIDRIASHDEPLAAHLRATVSTGAFCSYAPYSVESVEWDFTGVGELPESPAGEGGGPSARAAVTTSGSAPPRSDPQPPRRLRPRAARGLVERDAELAELEQALELTAAGSGDLLIVDGPAGIGKSALLAAVAAEAAERGFTVLRASGSELERGFGFGIAHQVFDSVLRVLPGDRRAELLRGAVTPAAAMLGYAEHEGESPPADIQTASLAILNGLYWLTAGLAREAPVVLVIDDAQWTDAPSAAWLNFTASRVADAPVLLVLGARPLGADTANELSDLLDGGDAGMIELAPLSADAVAVVVRTTWPEADTEFCMACHTASAGNPFYLHEIVAAARAAGITPDAAGAERLGHVTPESITRLVGRRLSELPETARALGRACAVLGSETELPVAANVAGIADDEALAAADALAAAGILVDRQPLQFTHQLIRSAVEADITLGARTLLHERAATILAERGAPSADVAAHVVHARPRGSADGVRCLREAAQQAGAHGSPDAAAALLERALAEPPDEPQVPGILLELARARYDTGEREAAESCLERALPLEKDPRRRAEIVLELSRPFDDVDTASRLELLDDAIEQVADLDAELRFRLEAKAVELLGDAFVVSVSPDLRRAHDERLARVSVLAVGDTAGERHLRAIYAVQKVIAADITASEARSMVTQALDDGVLMRRLAAGAWTADSAVEVLFMVDAFDQADRHAREAERHARDHGAIAAEAWACMLRAVIALQRGALLEANALLRSVYAITRQTRTQYVADVANQVQAWVCVERGDPAGAERACEALDQAGLSPAGTPYAKGRVHAASGAHDLAVPELRAACAALHVVGRWRNTLGSPRVDLVLSLAALGEHDEALRLATEELETARRFGAASAVGMALRSLGHASPGEEGLTHFADAVAVLAPSQAVLVRAHALHDLGAAQRAAGDAEAARESLRHALDLATRCGALRLRESTRAELMAAGGRSGPLAPTPAELLSPAELRVARLATEGESDLEIAQALFITVPTVERQLSMILAKLGLAKRAELSVALVA